MCVLIPADSEVCVVLSDAELLALVEEQRC